MCLFRELSVEEEQEFRQWARDNWTPGSEPNQVWHPVVRDEWKKIDENPTRRLRGGQDATLY